MCNADTTEYILTLKDEADRHWWIDPKRSVEIGDQIIGIAREQQCMKHEALGRMVRGDGLKLIERLEEAWQEFEKAGDLFLAAEDRVGWARTRIGRLMICVDLKRSQAALSDVPLAEIIFVDAGEHIFNLHLHLNTGLAHFWLGEARRALAIYQKALHIIEQLGEAGEQRLGETYLNMGVAHSSLGELDEARRFYQCAYDIATTYQKMSIAATALNNLANLDFKQGHYRQALTKLHEVVLLAQDKFPRTALFARESMLECYNALGQFEEAIAIGQEIEPLYRQYSANQRRALMLIKFASAHVGLARRDTVRVDNASNTAHYLDNAERILREAQHILEAEGATTYAAYIHLLQGTVAIVRGDFDAAKSEAAGAIKIYSAGEQQEHEAATRLLLGRALFGADQSSVGAVEQARQVLSFARSGHRPTLRYSAHLLLGRVGEAQGRLQAAQYHYQTAARLVEHLQRELTIMLRPGFLEDNSEALQALLHLHLAADDKIRAFETLERHKSQVFLGYLVNREQLRWNLQDPASAQMAETLHHLRGEYHRLTHLGNESMTSVRGATPPQGIANAKREIEYQIRGITQQLYLRSANAKPDLPPPSIDLADIQRKLPEDTMLIEYYLNERHLWAFTLDRSRLEIHSLAATEQEIRSLIDKFAKNLEAVRALHAEHELADALAEPARVLLQKLYHQLIEPLGKRWRDFGRLVIVPYGPLHCVPFNALHSKQAYLIEQVQIVILPAAGLLLRPAAPPRQHTMALAFAHNGSLPGVYREADLVGGLFGGTVYCDVAASRERLRSAPTQILHIAAHGKHMIDRPELSYIELADGPLFTDDLLQYDLSCELVTLSACETGRARPSGGDELIGLGRAVLYAGAAALVTTLWAINDDYAVRLMEQFYLALRAGMSKAAALRHAQQSLLRARPQTHPAFWAAFQLVGNPAPLTFAEASEAVGATS